MVQTYNSSRRGSSTMSETPYTVAIRIVASVLVFFCTNLECAQKAPEEEILMNHLFQNYSKHIRPSVSPSQTVNMTFGIAYVQLIELDDREQTLISSVWIRQSWYNHLLRWNPKVKYFIEGGQNKQANFKPPPLNLESR